MEKYLIPNIIDIDLRPIEVGMRLEFGHFEVDAKTETLTSKTKTDFFGYFPPSSTSYGTALDTLDSASEALDVQYQNIMSSLSLVSDVDIAAESSASIQAEILQQSLASLLSTVNQAPSITLGLI